MAKKAKKKVASDNALEGPNPAQLVAIAGAIKDTQIKKLKADLPRGETVSVDFTARFSGMVQIGNDQPGASGEAPARVDLQTPAVVSELLRRLGVNPVQLRKALRATVKAGHTAPYLNRDDNAALYREFERVEKETAEKLPAVPYSKPGRAASVSVDCNVQIIDPPPAGSSVKLAA